MWKVIKIWLALSIIYGLTSAYFYFATQEPLQGAEAVESSKGMSEHVELYKRSEFAPWSILASY